MLRTSAQSLQIDTDSFSLLSLSVLGVPITSLLYCSMYTTRRKAHPPALQKFNHHLGCGGDVGPQGFLFAKYSRHVEVCDGMHELQFS